jgi:hypothetical protein
VSASISEWPSVRGAVIRSLPQTESRCRYRRGRDLVESGPYALRNSRGHANCVRSGAQNRPPSASSSGAPGHGWFAGTLGLGERGVRRSEGPGQEVPVRRSSAAGHEHDRVWLNWSSTAAVAGRPISRATTDSALWPIWKPTWGGQQANGSYRCASFTLRASASVGHRRGARPGAAARSAVARHRRFGPGRTAPESRTTPESRTSAVVNGSHLGARCPGYRRCRCVVAGQWHAEAEVHERGADIAPDKLAEAGCWRVLTALRCASPLSGSQRLVPVSCTSG